MNIIVGEENIQDVNDRYLILELDSFRIDKKSKPIKTFCLIEEITLDSIFNFERYRDLHKNLLKNYRLKNWKFCLDALEHLKGQWNGELDSFYDVLEERVLKYQDLGTGPDWDGVIDKS